MTPPLPFLRNARRLVFPLFLFGLAVWPGCAEQPAVPRLLVQPDFRNAVWGMTQAQVMATEKDHPAEVRESDGEVIVKYDPVDAAEVGGRLIYIFANDKLVRAKYISNASHSELNDFIVDFHAVEPVLLAKYGKASEERAIWDNDEFQLERLPYLDQDRALPSSILPSDPLVGLSISLGHLRLYTRRTAGRTQIVHALTGADEQITHQIEYRSMDLEDFEDQVLHRPAADSSEPAVLAPRN